MGRLEGRRFWVGETPEGAIARPAGTKPVLGPRTRAPGAAKLYSDFAGRGSLPSKTQMAIQKETPRLWARLDLNRLTLRNSQCACAERPGQTGNWLHKQNESLERYRFTELIGPWILPMQRFSMENKLSHTTMFRIDPSRKMSRFYALDVQLNLFGGHSVVRNWGRIGTSGQMRIDLYENEREASDALNRIMRAKERRGYAVNGSYGLSTQI